MSGVQRAVLPETPTPPKEKIRSEISATLVKLKTGNPPPRKDRVRCLCSRARDTLDDSDLRSSLEYKHLHRWSGSRPPYPTNLGVQDLKKAAAGSERRLRLLRRQWTTQETRRIQTPTRRKDGSRRCEYCLHNNACMVAGCTKTPFGTKIPFRCGSGLHLCNAHGLTLSVDNGRSNAVRLKDGRVFRNVHVGTKSSGGKKRKRTSGDTPESEIFQLYRDLDAVAVALQYWRENRKKASFASLLSRFAGDIGREA